MDSQLAEIAETEEVGPSPEPTRASYSVGDTKTFSIYSTYSPTGSGSVQFKCLYVGSHCYIWTPTSSSNNTYPLDTIDSSFAQLAANEFDSKFDLMQSSFGNHTNGSSGDGKLHMLYYNINDGWEPGQGYIAGFFYNPDISNNGVPLLNIDTYPGVYYKNSSGTEYKRMDDTYNTMVHEYQHLINYSNTSGMNSWLNECFSAAAEEICYPGSSVVGRIQSWEGYYYSDNDDWLNPPAEFEYQSSNSLHTGYSLYAWSNSLDNTSLLTLYSQVSFFAQYLYTRFGNTIYKQISSKYSSSEVSAITSATGVSCADLARDFRIAVTANATQDQYNGIYGFKVQNGYDPDNYHGVQSPWDLLGPVIFTGTSCSIKGGGAITVKPVNGVYNPPSGASSSLKYYGIKLASPYTVTAVSNNENWGTVSVDGTRITATPANGYYVSGYEVVSGTATATINGNIIDVTPESDCTIRIIFAVKPLYTVNFVACGNTESSQTAYVNDVITLPSTVSAAADGWTFVGWMDHQIEETTTKPSYYAPGASYTVNGNATLYAVYTRVEEGGSVVYELLTAAPADWAGNYVITNNATAATSAYVLKGVTGSASGTNAESASNCTAFSSTGITLDGTTMSNVPNDYIITLTANGSYYTVKSAGTGCYYGMNSGSYLYAYSSLNSTYCNWTPAINTSGLVQLKNAANGQYPYFSWSSSNNYFWSGSTNNANVLKLYQETSSSATYYWTDPVAHQHSPAAAVVENNVAPSCTEAGSYDEVVYCSDCGEELSRTTVTVAALGHDFNDETGVCQRCGAGAFVTTFVCDEGCSVTVYRTQDMTANGTANAATAFARASDTGLIDISGNGQVNFVVNVESGYELVDVSAEGGYKNLKGPADTGVENGYRAQAPNGDNSPLDCDGTMTVNGGTVFGGGTNSMNENPSTSTSQPYVLYGGSSGGWGGGSSSTISSGKTVVVKNASSQVVFSIKAPKNINYAIYSDPTMTSSTNWSITSDSSTPTTTSFWSDHSYGSYTQTTAPTCTVPGVKTATCSVCGGTATQTVAATGHSWSHVTIAPTLSSEGYDLYTCATCGGQYRTNFTASTGCGDGNHVWNEGVVTQQPTCTTDGEKTCTCTVCGAVETVAIPALGHNFNETTGICSRCGAEAYKASFVCSTGCSVTVYPTQDLTSGGTANASTAFPRSSGTGLIDVSGDGQVNFVVNLEQDYRVQSVVVTPTANFKNLKGPSDTGVENGYRVTKMTGAVTITVTATDNPCDHEFDENGFCIHCGIEAPKVVFVTDGGATVTAYPTQDLTTGGTPNTAIALARDSATGEVDLNGNGQVNFVVNLNSGYELVDVTATGAYKNLKGPADTGVENGYRATKVSGTATVTITTNAVGYTVSLIASGSSQGSLVGMEGATVTLPSSVTVNPTDWTFIGWVAQQIAETTTAPTYYAPGASYTVTGDATLYALYSHVEGSGATVYELLTAAPSNWAGNYVITNNATSTSGMYVLKGVTGSASGTDAESASNCTAFASTGITLDGTTVPPTRAETAPTPSTPSPQSSRASPTLSSPSTARAP